MLLHLAHKPPFPLGDEARNPLLQRPLESPFPVSGEAARLAEQVKEMIDQADAFIQMNTATVCPHCSAVCCKNKHGYYDDEDLVYMYALGLNPPHAREGLDDNGPCQFLSESGCSIERSLRPFRCNWYFCATLLTHMEQGPAKPYRKFIHLFRTIVEMRAALVDEVVRTLSNPGVNHANQTS